jgi:hypothetical protein
MLLRVEFGDWEAVGSDGGLHSVHLYAVGCTALEAAQEAVTRARGKYGARADLSLWRFTVRQRNSTGPTLHFRVDANDRAVRLDD